MREVVEVIVQYLVDRPEEVVVSDNVRGNTVFVNVRVGRGETGKVIGRGGRIINAIRAVAATAAARQEMRAVVNIDDK